MSKKAIVLDANILIRAVLGKRVRELIDFNPGTVQFFAPDVADAEARKYLLALLEKRGVKRGGADGAEGAEGAEGADRARCHGIHSPAA